MSEASAAHQYTLTDEQKLIQETVRAFALEKVAPVANAIDAQARYPQEMFEALRELGYAE